MLKYYNPYNFSRTQSIKVILELHVTIAFITVSITFSFTVSLEN